MAVKIDAVKKVVIVGSGTMGQQIGFQCAAHGYDVVLYDIDAAALESARERIGAYAQGLLAGGAITAQTRDLAQARIAATTDLQSRRTRPT